MGNYDDLFYSAGVPLAEKRGAYDDLFEEAKKPPSMSIRAVDMAKSGIDYLTDKVRESTNEADQRVKERHDRMGSLDIQSAQPISGTRLNSPTIDKVTGRNRFLEEVDAAGEQEAAGVAPVIVNNGKATGWLERNKPQEIAAVEIARDAAREGIVKRAMMPVREVVSDNPDNAAQYSIDQGQKLIGKGVQAFGGAFGLPGIQNAGKEYSEEQNHDISFGGYKPEQSTIREKFNNEGFIGALSLAGDRMAENWAPSGAALIGGAATAVAATFSAPAALVLGGATGATSMLMGGGEVKSEFDEKGVEGNDRLAVGAGMIIGLLDRFGAGKVIPNDMLTRATGNEITTALIHGGYPEAAKAFSKEIGKKGLIEVGTENLQEGVSVGAAASHGATYSPAELLDRAIDTTVISLGMGGGMSTASTAIDTARGNSAYNSAYNAAGAQAANIAAIRALDPNGTLVVDGTTIVPPPPRGTLGRAADVAAANGITPQPTNAPQAESVNTTDSDLLEQLRGEVEQEVDAGVLAASDLIAEEPNAQQPAIEPAPVGEMQQPLEGQDNGSQTVLDSIESGPAAVEQGGAQSQAQAAGDVPVAEERYQWMRNKEGGQDYGNQQVISPLTVSLFNEHMAGKVRPELGSFDAYSAAFPGMHVSMVSKDNGKTWSLDGVGKREELRPNPPNKAWVKRVDDLNSLDSIKHGGTADSEITQPAPLPTETSAPSPVIEAPAAQPGVAAAPILHKNGNPFKSKGDARLALDGKHKALKDTHRITKFQDGFAITPKPERTAKQFENDAKMAAKAKARKSVNTDLDSISMAIRKKGGINKNADLAGEMRDLAFKSNFTGPVWRNDGHGIGIDEMARELHLSGYLQEDDVQELLDKLRDDHFGNPQFSSHRGDAPMEAAYQAHTEAQQEAHEATQAGIEALSAEDQQAIADYADTLAIEEDNLEDIPFSDAEFAAINSSQSLDDFFGELPDVRENEGSTGEVVAGSAQGSGEVHADTAQTQTGGDPGFTLEGQTNSEIAAAEQTAAQSLRDEVAAQESARRASDKAAEEQHKKDNATNGNAADAFSMTPTEPVDKRKQNAIDKAKAKTELAGQTDIFSQPESKPSANTIFTEDAAAAARAILKKKLSGQLNSGIDPEVLQAGMTLAGYHIEKGARTFTAYAKAMIDDMGDMVKPYLKSWYLGIKYDPRAATFAPDMTGAGQVEQFDISAFDEPKPNEMAKFAADAREEQRQWDAENERATKIGNKPALDAQTKFEDGDIDLAEFVALLDAAEKEAQNEIQGGTDHANTLQTESVPEGSASETPSDAGAGHRDSKPLGAGLAEDGQGAGGVGGIPSSTGESGAAGKGRADQAGEQSPGAPRDSGNLRPESDATGSEPDFSVDAESIGKGGLSKKYGDNIAAIRIIKAMEAEGRVATPEERKQISKYVGWGALKGVFDSANKTWAKQHAELNELLTDTEFKAARASTLDAHYTSPAVVKAMYSAMERIGFTGGRVLEPSVGVGNFFGMMPTAMRNASHLHGVELDALTSRLVAALYPKAKIAQSTSFSDFQIPAEYFDAVIGNPPFGSSPLVDNERSPYSGFSIHNYFLAKAIDKLRPGGIMQVVVSHNFLDAQDSRTRKWIADRANLIGGARLPNTAFKENSGTEVVTDILIFQKKGRDDQSKGAMWVDVVDQVNHNSKTGESATHKVNKFFTAYPNNILGTPSAAGSMYSANEYTVEANGDIKEQLDGWVATLPKDIFSAIDRRADKSVVDMAIHDGIKAGSFFVDAKGNVMRRGEDVMGNKTAHPWAAPNEKAPLRMKGMIALRDALRQQMRLERSLDASEVEIESNRKKLNNLYDNFLRQYGHINNQVNRKLFLDDTESQLVQALEFDFDKGIGKTTAERDGIEQKPARAKKADIFNRRVAFPPQDFLTVNTAKDALLASLNYRGKVDQAYMAEVYHKPMDEIISELGDVVFDDPQSGIVTADEYLSGDVKTKLAEAQSAAREDAKYKRNVEALESVIPIDKKPSEISASIGASFVPAELYEQFVKHISGSSATAFYIKATGQWSMSYSGATEPALNTGKFGTSDLNAMELFGLSMAGRGAVVKKIIKNMDGSTTTILLEKETEAAREKQNAIKAEWQKWVWSDAERADRLASIYNEKMNRIVERKFDGGHMTFPGMNPGITLLEHQKNGVWRGLQSYQVLYDHVVGAGKTFEMAALAMEMRRVGIARKPLFVVPNHLTLQWRSEFTRLYPGSNILAATPEDFGKGNRERMFAKIITGDWDAVVIGHSSLKKIGLPEATEKAVLQEQLDEISAAIEEMKRTRGDRNIIGDMEKIKKNLEAKFKEKLAAIGSRDKVVTFDELGVDAMFVDEMHEFKNLTYNSTMDRNPGMGNPAGSAKAFDMFVKTRYLFDTFGEKTPYISATGTPVSNSLVEMFNMQRYMQYPTLKREGLHVFDAWAKQFGSVESVYEVAPSGSGYRQSTRFAKFNNLPALMGLYNSFADTVTLDDLKAQEEAQGKRFPVPKIQGGRPTIIVAKRSPLVSEHMGIPRAEVDEYGAIKFGVDLSNGVEIKQNDKNGKFDIRVGDAQFGQADTEQDAKLNVVAAAVSPSVTVDQESILGRFGRLKQLTKETKGKVNALSLTGEANKAGMDFRLINPDAPDFDGSKINLAVGNIKRIYDQWSADKGAQLVFCDMSIPLSARASYGSKARRLYVRDESHAVEMKRGTMHTLEGHEDLPYFIVQRGEGETKRFDAYDAVSGGKLFGDYRTKPEAKERVEEILSDIDKRQVWIRNREGLGEIAQEQIDDYNNDNDVETDGMESFSREDIAGVSGASKFSVYDDIKAKLVAKGIPENEVAFIHDYSTPTAKDKLFKAVNDGSIRVLLGSTPKMGAGTNVQERLVALHHIDAPWRPSDLEQREGRIIRRGNKLYERDPEGFEIFIGRYATEQTYDTRRWQILEHKARGIEQLRNFDGSINEIDDIDGEAANSSDMKAAASGDPLILDETKLRNDVRRLEQLQAGHADEVLAMTRKAKIAKAYAENAGPGKLADLQKQVDMVAKHPLNKDGFSPVTVDGKKIAAKDAALDAIERAVSVVRAGLGQSVTISYRGLDFKLHIKFAQTMFADAPDGDIGSWGPSEQFSPSGFLQRMANYAARLPASVDTTNGNIAKAESDAVAMSEQAKQPFSQAADLEHAREEHKKVQRALMAKGPTVPDDQKEEVDRGIQAQKERLEKLGFGEALKEMFGKGNALLSRTETTSTGTNKAIIESMVKRVQTGWQNGPTIIVVQSVEELRTLNPSLYGEVLSHGAEGDMEGVYLPDSKTVYLIADHLDSNKHAMQVLLHETKGHYGLREVFGAGLTPILNQIYATNKVVRERADKLTALYGYDKTLATEEALADLAGEGQAEKLNMWKRLVAFIRSKLHGWGVEWSDSDVRALLAQSGRFVEHGTSKARIAHGGGTAASRIQRDSILSAGWKMLAGDMSLYQNPTPDSFDLVESAREIDSAMVVAEDKPSPSEDKKGMTRKWYVTMPDKTHAWVYENKVGDVWINASNLGEGVSGGTKLYLLVGSYAEANGKVFIGDPAGLSDVALIRRTENMLSLALRFGTTKFLEPHEFQMNPAGKYGTVLDGIARPITWVTGDDQNNLDELLKTSASNINNLVPEIKEVEYNFETGRFEKDGKEFTNADFEKLRSGIAGNLRKRGLSEIISTRDSRANPGAVEDRSPIGSATLKRTAVSNTLARAASSGAGRELLDRISELLPRGLKDAPLRKILYSRKTPSIQPGLPGVGKLQQQPIPQQPSLGLTNGVTGNQASWDAPEASRLDGFIYQIQNKHIDMKRVKDAIEKSFGAVADKWNPYLKEELFHERAASRVKSFVEGELTPILEVMAKEKISQGDLGQYLWARHAKEANAYIATINSKLPDGGSGMNNQAADDYMANLDPAMKQTLETLAKKIDAINHKTRMTMVNYGLISPNDVTIWENTYQHYIPLNREDMDHMGHGNGTEQGFSIKGKETQRRTGSELAVAVNEILGSIAMQRERAIARGEKNRVGLALFGMAKLHPNPDFWVTDKAPSMKVVQNINGQDQVVEMADPLFKNKDNVVVVKIPNTRTGKVEEHAIIFNERNERAVRMASAIKNLEGVQLGEVMSATAKVTRYFAAINTQYNPIFGVLNLTRDIQTAALNLTNTPLAGKQLKILNDTRSILFGAMKHGMRDFDGQWKSLSDEFHAEGGATGYRDVFITGKERAEALQKALDPDWWTKTTWGKAITLKGYVEFPMVMAMDKGLRPVLNWLSDYNEVMENATRLAAYKEAKAMGMSREQAASIAKNLTVNFNRKGEKAMQIGAMYAFFNAAVQGMTRDGSTLRGPAGKRIVLGGMLIGAIQSMALAFAGFGDDEPTEFVKERNLVFPIGNGKYLTLPMPLTFNVLPNLGRMATELILTGGKKAGDKAVNMLGILLDASNPLGGSSPALQIVLPTVLDPMGALAQNKDWTGKTIYRDDFSGLHPTPGFTRSKDASSMPSRWLAEAINTATGGDKYAKGQLSPTPDQIDFLIGQVMGGVGRELSKVATTVTALVTGEDLPTHKVPLLGRFYGDTTGQSSQGTRFYENIKNLNEIKAGLEGRMKDGRQTAQFKQDNPEYKMVGAAVSAERKVSALRSRKHKLIENGDNKADIKIIDTRITSVMKSLNDRVAQSQP